MFLRRLQGWLVVSAPVVLLASLLGPGCSSSSSSPSLATGCKLNSDCSGDLICAYGFCHVQCNASKDCSGGSMCIPPGVCELPQETACSSTLPCVTGLVCANDTCLAPCTPGVATGSPGGCEQGQSCTTQQGISQTVCVDVPGGGGDGGPGGDGATGGDGTTGSDGGDGGAGTCPTDLGGVAQGDSNASFQSGVGAIGPNTLYLFTSYEAAAGDAGQQDYEIYVQAFDLKTGVSKGPSRSLFAPTTLGLTLPSGQQQFFVTGAAVAPTGDIALVYYIGGAAGVYVAILSPSAADGGVAGLGVQHVVLVGNNSIYASGPGGGPSTPHVIWSNASQSFIVNYKFAADQMALYKYAVDGQLIGSDSPIPTINGADEQTGSNGSVGESGNLLAVATLGSQTVSGEVGLTVLDESENLIGSPLVVVGSGVMGSAWAEVAGTAQGFVCFYDDVPANTAGEVFVSTSTDAGLIGSDGGSLTLPGFSFTPRAVDARVVSDDVGTGGQGGVGVALAEGDGTVKFAYVSADGASHQGPSQALPLGGTTSSISMANFNGSFAISAYNKATSSAQVVATGICP